MSKKVPMSQESSLKNRFSTCARQELLVLLADLYTLICTRSVSLLRRKLCLWLHRDGFLFTGGAVVFHKPVHCRLDAFLYGSELEIWPICSELLVRGCLFELPICFARVVDQVPLEIHGITNHLGNVALACNNVTQALLKLSFPIDKPATLGLSAYDQKPVIHQLSSSQASDRNLIFLTHAQDDRFNLLKNGPKRQKICYKASLVQAWLLVVAKHPND